MGDEGADPGITAIEDTPGRKGVSRKVVAIVVVGVLLGVSGLYVWYEYYRHWNISDLERAAIVVEWEFMGGTFPNALGFKEHLAGRTVTVEGTVSSTKTMITNLGTLTIVYLEGSVFCGLMLWDEPVPEDGTRVEIPVTFEWGTVNNEEAVYSRQTTLPGFGTLAMSQPVAQALTWVHAELVLGLTDTGDEMILNLEGCPEPIPLGMMRCSLMSGTHIGTQDYIDFVGLYSDNPCVDQIQDMSEGVSLNGTIDFEDDDGYFDGGDSFVLKNLSRPDTDSGAQTYLLSVERDLYAFEEGEDWREHVLQAYIIVTKRGALWVENPRAGVNPTVGDWHQSTVTDGQAFTLEYVHGPPDWNSTVLAFGDSLGHIISWSIPNGTLGSGSYETLSLGIKELWNLSIECVVTDVLGNGLPDRGDRIEIIARNGTNLETGHRYWARLVVKGTGADFLSEDILFHADPVSECVFICEDGIASTVFSPLYNLTGDHPEDVDAVWGEVTIRLEADGNETEWSPATDGLWGNGEMSWESETSTFGEMSLACSVRDLQGNGAVNAGDSVQIAMIPVGEGADPDVVYTVSFIYAPTGATIFSASFTGAS